MTTNPIGMMASPVGMITNPLGIISERVGEIVAAADGVAAWGRDGDTGTPADMRAAVVSVHAAATDIRWSAAFVLPKNAAVAIRDIRVAANRVAAIRETLRAGDLPPEYDDMADTLKRTKIAGRAAYNLHAAITGMDVPAEPIPDWLEKTMGMEIRVIREAADRIIVRGIMNDLRRRSDQVIAAAGRAEKGKPITADLTAAAAIRYRLDELLADPTGRASELLTAAAELADLLTAE